VKAEKITLHDTLEDLLHTQIENHSRHERKI
jgi:hypothetical protein